MAGANIRQCWLVLANGRAACFFPKWKQLATVAENATVGRSLTSWVAVNLEMRLKLK